MERVITEQILMDYQEYLYEEEKTAATIKKYICDLRKLAEYADGKEITKKLMVAYKEYLYEERQYKLTSINSFLAAIIQTVCSTGIRISELKHITVESLEKGVVEIYCKGKQRKVLLPGKLVKLLLRYCGETGIESGTVFRTKRGKAVDRSNVWKEMKALGAEVDVAEEKIFPHNLRHLFAKTFYEIDRDMAKLADMLGHSSIETTRIYVMTTREEHQRQLDLMGLI